MTPKKFIDKYMHLPISVDAKKESRNSESLKIKLDAKKISDELLLEFLNDVKQLCCGVSLKIKYKK